MKTTKPKRAPKVRRVILTIELSTDALVGDLKRFLTTDMACYGRVVQVQANVIQPPKERP